jgi:formamidopyrimidine-DNA glycosylase
MPELPEVQTVLDTLELQIKDQKINEVIVLYSRMIESDLEQFKNELVGQHFRKFKRRGKYLLFEMDNLCLVTHLRMEGKFYLKQKNEEIDKHTHIIFRLYDGRDLRYNDVRKFGKMYLTEIKGDYKVFRNLGVEPFSEDFNLAYCKAYLNKSRKVIKQDVLNQSFISGIGNIYADEIVFAIGKHPMTVSSTLTDNDILNLIKETRRILDSAIKDGGTTIRSYTSSLGVSGKFQLHLMVHQRENEPCKICGTTIIKTKVKGRGTYYCPKCQKKSKKIAITGTIGSGKSTVAKIFRKNGYFVYDSDEVSKELSKKGGKGYKQIVKTFDNILDFNDEIDRSKLAEIIFNDKDKKEKLEQILHPLILEDMLSVMKSKDLFIAEVPLLFESDMQKHFDEVILVVSNDIILIERLLNKGLNLADIQSRIINQLNVKEKMKKSNVIIKNNADVETLEKKVITYIKNNL